MLSLLQKSRSTAVKVVRKITEAHLGLSWAAIVELFFAKINRWKTLTTSKKKDFIISVLQGPKYASEGFFF